MCGIVAVISNSNVIQNLLNGLKKLQNRGYDSAGICTIQHSEFIVNKYASTHTHSALFNLEQIRSNNAKSLIGIGHTRWATHGAKTDANSHPHVSSDNKFAIVHNGIIENYKILKTLLLNNGYTFKSDTDSEVIANLLAYYYKQTNSVLEAINKIITQMEGTWGICILCIDSPNTIYCIRNGSPLLVGQSTNSKKAMIVSEQSAFESSIKQYFALKNNDICIINKNDTSINIITQEKDSYILKDVIHSNELQLETTEFPHWTIKEIYEQPKTMQQAISFGGRILTNNTVKLGGLDTNIKKLKIINNVILLGCGTSYNAGLLGSYYFKDLCDFSCVQVIDGADFSISDVPKYGKTCLILLSQSGETKDLHRCIQIARENNLFTIGVVNVVDSLIAREVDCGCYLNAGREVGVASTKSFTSQCIILSMIAIWFSQIHEISGEKRQQYINDLLLLSKQTEDLLGDLDRNVDNVLPIFREQNSCFILGKGQNDPIAKEGSLKIKEISYIHAEAYPTSSLKHGPFALLKKGFPVILTMPDDEHFSKNRNAYYEVKSREAAIIIITNTDTFTLDENKNNNDFRLIVPYNKTYNAILNVIPLQLIAYKLAVSKGLNPDMPRNLAKVVTVE